MRLRYLYIAVFLLLAGAAGWRATHKPPEPPRPVQGTISKGIPRPTPKPPGPPDATAEEIARLASPDRIVRLEGAELLGMRSVTPALMTAVEKAAIDYADDEAMMLNLRCIKVRFPDRASLDLALSLLPTDASGFQPRLQRPVSCAFNAVVARAEEDPARIRPILLSAALSANYSTSEAAVRGLERTPPGEFPPMFQVQAHAPDSYQRDRAVRAAMAAGAIDVLPTLVEHALLDEERSVRATARAYLKRSKSANAARLVAFALVRGTDDARTMEDLFVDRDNEFHDVTAALLDVAEDETAEMAHREATIPILVKRGNAKMAAPRLRALRDRTAGEYRRKIEEAVVELDRRAAGLPAR